jgi:hypothetical protein
LWTCGLQAGGSAFSRTEFRTDIDIVEQDEHVAVADGRLPTSIALGLLVFGGVKT